MLVMAHEIGHNFGMIHDTLCKTWCSQYPNMCASDGQTLTYGGSNGNFIMWPVSVDGSLPDNYLFSLCSLDSAGTVSGKKKKSNNYMGRGNRGLGRDEKVMKENEGIKQAKARARSVILTSRSIFS